MPSQGPIHGEGKGRRDNRSKILSCCLEVGGHQAKECEECSPGRRKGQGLRPSPGASGGGADTLTVTMTPDSGLQNCKDQTVLF